jgi:adenylate kinase family enzyme
MQRVVIVGNSGSGKSTLGRVIATRIGAEFLEVDSINHQADWQPLPRAELVRRVDAFTSADRWVVDGNYGAIRPLTFARADTVVWLDLPRHLVMRQVIGRTIGRVSRRQELWNGNRERWANFFSLDPDESVIVWAWTRHEHYRSLYAAAMTDPANAHLTFVRLRSRREVNGLRDDLP